MELGYLRRLHLGIAGRVSFGKRMRPVAPIGEQLIDQRLISEVIAADIIDLIFELPFQCRVEMSEMFANRFYDRCEVAKDLPTKLLYGAISCQLMRCEAGL